MPSIFLWKSHQSETAVWLGIWGLTFLLHPQQYQKHPAPCAQTQVPVIALGHGNTKTSGSKKNPSHRGNCCLLFGAVAKYISACVFVNKSRSDIKRLFGRHFCVVRSFSANLIRRKISNGGWDPPFLPDWKNWFCATAASTLRLAGTPNRPVGTSTVRHANRVTNRFPGVAFLFPDFPLQRLKPRRWSNEHYCTILTALASRFFWPRANVWYMRALCT